MGLGEAGRFFESWSVDRLQGVADYGDALAEEAEFCAHLENWLGASLVLNFGEDFEALLGGDKLDGCFF